MHHRHVSFVENGVVDVTALEKEVACLVDDRSIWKDIGHIACGDLANSGTNVVVLPDVPRRLES
jgi:hypothetical protein